MKNIANLIAIIGALVGAVIGHAVFVWLAKSFGALGFAIPGVLVGIGASFRYGISAWVSILCGLLGLGVGIFSTWKVLPFVADQGFAYFLGHLHELPTYQQLLLGLGAAVAFWLPFRRRRSVVLNRSEAPGS